MPYHHYVSAFHLAQFTAEPERGRDAGIYQFDLRARRRFSTPVNRAGGEGAYNAVAGVPGIRPESVEEHLGRRYEDPAVPVLRALTSTYARPSEAELHSLLEYFALLSANNPSRRGAMNDGQERGLYFMALQMLASPDTFAAAQAGCRRDGVPVLGDVSYDELRAITAGGSLTYQIPTEAHVRGLEHLIEQVARLLRARTWSLIVAPPDIAEFICGDHPVVIGWTVERQREMEAASRGGPVFPPGFASEDTEVVVPLSRRTALLGVFGGVAGIARADRRMVAEVNGRMVRTASRFVYSAEPTFIFNNGASTILESSVLVTVA